ncbi:MAG: hypothetical protein ACKOCC_08495, partial [Actinomycetota bacterium]
MARMKPTPVILLDPAPSPRATATAGTKSEQSAMSASIGADVRVDGHEIVVAPRPYLPTEYRVEPDFSSAAFQLAAAVIAGGRVRIP